MKSTGARRFLIVFLSSFCLLYVSYFLAFKYQLGAAVEAAWWVKNIYAYKDYLARTTNSPRVLIVAGSNALFGIDSNVVERILGRKVINLATHGALGLDFLSLKLEQQSRPDEIVVLPLEHDIYHRDVTDWFVNNMLAWGWDDFLKKLSSKEMVSFLFHVSPLRILEGVYKQTGINPLLDEKTVVEQVLDVPDGSLRTPTQFYNHQRLNVHGDLLVDQRVHRKLLKKLENPHQYFFARGYDNVEFSPSFIRGYRLLRKLQAERNLKLIFTWPATIRNKGLNLYDPAHRQYVERFKSWLADSGIEISCHPGLFNLDIIYFLDSVKHLNKHGAVIRSENLGNCIKSILDGGAEPALDYPQALATVEAQEARYRAYVIKPKSVLTLQQ